ncbi:MAG: alanine--tRNA ligase [Chloroflexi bacterium]|nr:alanine--tRNA ligase [Chloroflexota bacterium]
MNSNELRDLFLRFFEEKGHTVLPSSSLVPHGDTTLLLTSAGMVQMKPYFVGEATPPNRRLASSQKCFRMTDIDCVGDAGHLTFFEMLGNFSVGDYFKKESIEWAWEFVNERLQLPKDRLWITVFLDDDEAEGYWLDLGMPKERIIRCDEKDNFWGPAGETGPCGPCSEIHYDFGEGFGCGSPDCGPSCDCDRFSEIWNLVFTEYDQDVEGNRTALKQKNIDTGMGLERTAALMQGKSTVYETDLFMPLMNCLTELTGHKYGESDEVTRAMRVVAEHGRAMTFLIGDGVIPSNEGRGYVLRRLLRRSIIFSRKLGIRGPFLGDMAIVVIREMNGVYPELKQHRDKILRVINDEEMRFDEIIEFNMDLLQDYFTRARGKGITNISGKDAFYYHDTRGLPVDVLREIAEEEGFSVDLDGFEEEMEQQRERARAAQKFGLIDKTIQKTLEELTVPPTPFVGYDTLSINTRILALMIDGKTTWANPHQGQEVEIILDKTPFYAEMGGQVSDTGEISGPTGRVEVYDVFQVQRISNGESGSAVIHKGRVVAGVIFPDDNVVATVNEERRLDIARNHTATHLLHAVLRKVLGDQVKQGGSFVAPDHFRFDYTHLIAMNKEELAEVQKIVNENIRRNYAVSGRGMPYQQAVEAGALAFFGEKYGDVVRMVEIGTPDLSAKVSAELCGGTHLRNTGEIGFFHITSEKSIGSGLRRIEAVTGRGAEALAEERISVLENVASQLETNSVEAAEKLVLLISEFNAERKRAKELEGELLRKTAESLLAEVKQVDGVNVLAGKVTASNMELLRETGDWLKDKLGSAVIVLGVVVDGNPRFLAMVTPDLVDKGIHAGKIIKQVAQVAGGGGGGKPDMAQAGGKDKSKIDEALKLVPRLVGK